MLLQKLAELADMLDKKGHSAEADQVDALLRFITAGMKCKCKCDKCKTAGKHECECESCAKDGEMCACI